MTNIYDTAHQLERELRDTPEFKTLKEAHEKVTANKESNELFEEFRAFQMMLQEKQMTGAQFSDEDISRGNDLSTRVQADELIAGMMEKERAFSIIVNDLNGIIMAPVSELYAK
ncbi:YlbF family regulator [Enterococcus nangangensis]|uniref:YlbF family regulator n=1 Tax=Enterococcus nangangensis TaxID=2559926 RepID=UPI0010FA6102|nr:YlbF family regulator [Enterococcus nangangensis]